MHEGNHSIPSPGAFAFFMLAVTRGEYDPAHSLGRVRVELEVTVAVQMHEDWNENLRSEFTAPIGPVEIRRVHLRRLDRSKDIIFLRAQQRIKGHMRGALYQTDPRPRPVLPLTSPTSLPSLIFGGVPL